jgi:hypothetical protein
LKHFQNVTYKTSILKVLNGASYNSCYSKNTFSRHIIGKSKNFQQALQTLILVVKKLRKVCDESVTLLKVLLKVLKISLKNFKTIETLQNHKVGTLGIIKDKKKKHTMWGL